MNINQKIEKALEGVTEDIWAICCPDDTLLEEYIVYSPEVESAGYFADDEDQEWVQYMQVHLFCKKNYMALRKEIRKRLKEAEFVVTDIETLYEKDTKYFHLCCECYAEEE